MNNLLEFESFQPGQQSTDQQPGQGPAPLLPQMPSPAFKVDFSVSGVSDEAMKLISGLMAQAVLASGEAERMARMADTDPVGAASYLQKKVEGILSNVPGTDPKFIQSLKSQSGNIAKSMVLAIPGLLGSLTDKDIQTSELKPDTSKTSFLSKLSGFFADQA